MIGYLLSRRKIRELEARLKNKEKEAEELHARLEGTMKPGIYKSDFCKFCENHVQLGNGFYFCILCDTMPCEHFSNKNKDVPAATDTPLKVRFGLKTRNGYIPLSESCCELSHNGIKSSTVKEKNQERS